MNQTTSIYRGRNHAGQVSWQLKTGCDRIWQSVTGGDRKYKFIEGLFDLYHRIFWINSLLFSSNLKDPRLDFNKVILFTFPKLMMPSIALIQLPYSKAEPSVNMLIYYHLYKCITFWFIKILAVFFTSRATIEF